MNLIIFLIEVLKVLGLIFLIGIVFNLIIDVIILRPIQNRIMNKKQEELMDAIIKQIKKGNITIEDLEKFQKNIDEKIEK